MILISKIRSLLIEHRMRRTYLKLLFTMLRHDDASRCCVLADIDVIMGILFPKHYKNKYLTKEREVSPAKGK